MLADDHAVESSVLHSNTVIDNLPKGATHISMSTISVALSRRLADEHAKRGQKYMAAPVFGRPDAAAGGKLFIAAAGDKEIDGTLPAGARGSGSEDVRHRRQAGDGELW